MRPHSTSLPGDIQVLDPLQHPNWDGLLSGHASACFFHTRAWAAVLRDTYGHKPAYVCRFLNGQLDAVLPLMEVSSSLTGRRGVSLPFTDACESVHSTPGDCRALYEAAMRVGQERGWRYLECRAASSDWAGSSPSLEFWGHTVELEGGPDALFRRLDSSIRRGIRKAEASGLRIEFGSTLEAILDFFALHCGTRRRHGVPPQPVQFFENIVRNVFALGNGFVVTAHYEQKPVAAAVFFQSGRRAIYKFGASDYAWQHLRPNNLVMWGAIKRLAEQGFMRLDMGRTSMSNEGLQRFKLGFGAREEKIEYCRYDYAKRSFVRDIDRAEGWANHVFRLLPPFLFRAAGRMLYPHLS